MLNSRPSLKSLKRQAYELYGVSCTRELKAQVGNFDFRQRDSWLEILTIDEIIEDD